MRFFKLLLFPVFVLFLLQSCQTTNEIWLNQDGTAKVSNQTDLSAALPFLMMGMQEELNKMKEEVEENNEVENLFTKMFMEDGIDTTIQVKSMFLQAVSKEAGEDVDISELENMSKQDIIALMKLGASMEDEVSMDVVSQLIDRIYDATIRFQIDQDAGLAVIEMIQPLESWEDINMDVDLFSSMEDLMSLARNDEMDADAQNMLSMLKGVKPVYEISDKQLVLKKKGLDVGELMPEEMSGGPSADEMAMIESMFGGMEEKYIIHFPGKVKKVSGVDARVDGNTVEFVMPGMTSDNAKEDLNMTFKFKAKKRKK